MSDSVTLWNVPCQASLSLGFLGKILEWVVISFYRGSSWPRDRTHVSCIGRQILYFWVTWEALFEIYVNESHSVVYDSLWRHGHTVHRILQGRILEWVVVPFSRGSSQPRDQPRSLALRADSLQAEPQGKPKNAGVGSVSLTSPVDLPDLGIESGSPALQKDSLPTELPGKPQKGVLPPHWGIEPWSFMWQAGLLTTILKRIRNIYTHHIHNLHILLFQQSFEWNN